MQAVLSRYIGFSLPIAVILSATQVFAYPVTIKNATSANITIRIERGLCPSLDDSVKAAETKTIETGTCCSTLVRIVTTGGPAYGGIAYRPPDTAGFGVSCRGYSITVSMKTGSLRVTEGIH